jgi:hypothetical protein
MYQTLTEAVKALVGLHTYSFVCANDIYALASEIVSNEFLEDYHGKLMKIKDIYLTSSRGAGIPGWLGDVECSDLLHGRIQEFHPARAGIDPDSGPQS